MITSPANQKVEKKWLVIAAIVTGSLLMIYQYAASHRPQPTASISKPRAAIASFVPNNNLSVNTNTPQVDVAATKPPVRQQTVRQQVRKYRVPLVVGKRTTLETVPATVVDNKETLSNDNSTLSRSFSVLDSFYRSIAKQPVIYQINPQKDTTVNLPEGTVITIPANTLVYANGHPANGTITFSATEFYDKASMICNRLSTMNNEFPLVTGGMLHLTAKDATGMDLMIKSGSTVDIQMPYKTRDEAMQLFIPESKPTIVNANKNNSSVEMLNSLNWLANGQWQTRMPEPTASVIDWTTEPDVIYGNKTKAIYRIDPKCELTNEQVKAELKKRFPEYDKIKVRRAWKHPIGLFGIYILAASKQIGERETMPLARAKRLKLITPKEEAEALKAFQQQLKQYRNDSILLAAMAQLQNKYGFKVSSLGLINCDRFYTDPRPKVWYTINKSDAAEKNFVHRLFFHSMNAIMPAHWETDKAFANIPAGEEVTLVSVGEKNGQTVASFKTFTTAQSAALTLNYQPTEPATFKKELQSVLSTLQHQP